MVLRELGIEERPLPTKTIADYYDHLRKSIVTLLSLHKIAAKKETLLHQRKNEIKHLGGEITESEPEVKVTQKRTAQQQQMMAQKRKSAAAMDAGGGGQNKRVKR